MIQQLSDGAARLGLALPESQTTALMAYLDLMQKWNKVYNLTALRDPADMLTHHLLDSLAVVAPLRIQLAAMAYALDGAPAAQFRLLDVGSGAGLPGVVIAICCPEVQVDCVDTVAKKAAFINQVAATLKLPNLRALHRRVETLGAAGEEKYDAICSRAFSSLADFIEWSSGALAEGGIWLAMKGKNPVDELAVLQQRASLRADVFHVEQLAIPGLDAERCIVWIRKPAD